MECLHSLLIVFLLSRNFRSGVVNAGCVFDVDFQKAEAPLF